MADFEFCPSCGRQSLEFTVSDEGEHGYVCRCGYRSEDDRLAGAYADDIDARPESEPELIEIEVELEEDQEVA